MSENYSFYVQKMAKKMDETRVDRPLDRPLRDQLGEILSMVRYCESMWALEDRMDRQLGLH